MRYDYYLERKHLFGVMEVFQVSELCGRYRFCEVCLCCCAMTVYWVAPALLRMFESSSPRLTNLSAFPTHDHLDVHDV